MFEGYYPDGMCRSCHGRTGSVHYQLCRECWRIDLNERKRNKNYPVSLKELGGYIGLSQAAVGYMVRKKGWDDAMDYYEKRYKVTDLPRSSFI